MAHLLIIDDDRHILDALRLFLEDEFDEVITQSSPQQLAELTHAQAYDVLLLDMNFAVGKNTGQEGFYWLDKVLQIDPNAVVILMTAYGSVGQAVQAIRVGAMDFVLKPWDNDKLLATIHSGIQLRKSKLEIENQKNKTREVASQLSYQFVGGRSPAMQAIFETIDKVAATEANILIVGENGTGKELAAREIHRLSNRSDEIFLGVDMGSLNESIFESELFGHKKGAFTDARTNRTGRFIAASGGTLFLDEIGNLSVSLQAKLLTALQNRQVFPVGADKPAEFDIRLISATNRSLQEMVNSKLFREDLLYRINTITLEIPPLRRRIEDIPKLVQYFLRRYKTKYAKPELKISGKTINYFKKYSWPGNVRELQHAIEKAVILADHDTIKSEVFQLENPGVMHVNQGLTLSEIERQAIVRALQNHKGNLSEAARELGITRQTIYNKMRGYGI